MKIAVMQPYTFPYIGYFQLVYACDVFVFYDDVNFIKKGYINKNFLLHKGKRTPFTFPCKAISQNKTIRDTELNITLAFAEKCCKTLEHNYKKAPFFEDVFPLIAQYITHFQERSIAAFAQGSIRLVCDYLGIERRFIQSSEAYDNAHLKGENRILDIAVREQAKTYINPIGGKTLYTKDHFEKKGISLQFLEPKRIAYPQFQDEFVPWLSIIDVLMFNDKKTTVGYLKKYTLS